MQLHAFAPGIDMIRNLFSIAIIISCVELASAGSAVAECRSCASTLTLSRVEWSCLKPRLAEYLEDNVDPVIASVINCESRIARSANNTVVKSGDPDIRPGVFRDLPDSNAARKVFSLTRKQVQCLQGRIDELIRTGNETPVATDLTPCLPR